MAEARQLSRRVVLGENEKNEELTFEQKQDAKFREWTASAASVKWTQSPEFLEFCGMEKKHEPVPETDTETESGAPELDGSHAGGASRLLGGRVVYGAVAAVTLLSCVVVSAVAVARRPAQSGAHTETLLRHLGEPEDVAATPLAATTRLPRHLVLERQLGDRGDAPGTKIGDPGAIVLTHEPVFHGHYLRYVNGRVMSDVLAPTSTATTTTTTTTTTTSHEVLWWVKKGKHHGHHSGHHGHR